jgi:hypothetical protein
MEWMMVTVEVARDLFREQIGGAQGIFEREKVYVRTETPKRGLGVIYAT